MTKAKVKSKAKTKAKAKVTSDLPNLDNATPSFLIDEIGDNQKKLKKAEKLDKYLKQALYARLEPKERSPRGEKYSGSITQGQKVSINLDDVREELGEDWCEEHSKTTNFNTLRIKTNE